MNADNRDQQSPFGDFRLNGPGANEPARPAAPAPAQPAAGQPRPPYSAPQQSGQPPRQPLSGQQPASGQPPRQPLSGQQPATGQPPRQPLSGQPPRQPLSGQQPQSGQQPNSSGTPQRSSIRAAATGQQAAPTSGIFPPTTGAPATFNAATGTGQAIASPASSTQTATVDDEDAPRKARVMVSRIDPRSALKIGFLLSVAAGVMLTIAVFVVWNVLNQLGFFALANEWVSKLFTEDQELNLMQFFHQGRVMSATILISVINVFLLTALATIWAFLYNTVSSVVGGVYVTLADD